MIRLRSKEGKEIPLDDSAAFIELCDSDGGIGCVFYKPDEEATVQIEPDSDEAELYSNRFGVKFIKVFDIRDRYDDE